MSKEEEKDKKPIEQKPVEQKPDPANAPAPTIDTEQFSGFEDKKEEVKQETKPVEKEEYQPWGDILDYKKLREEEEAAYQKKMEREKGIRNYTMLGEALRNIGEGIGVTRGAHQDKREINFSDKYIKAVNDLDADRARKLEALRREAIAGKRFDDQMKYQQARDAEGVKRSEYLFKYQKEKDDAAIAEKAKDREYTAAENEKNRKAQKEIAGINADNRLAVASTAKPKAGSTGAVNTIDFADGKGGIYKDVPISDVALMASNYLANLRKRASNIQGGTDYINAKKELETLQKSPEWKALESLASGKIEGEDKELSGVMGLVWDEMVYNSNKAAREGKTTTAQTQPAWKPEDVKWNPAWAEAATTRMKPAAAEPAAEQASPQDIAVITDKLQQAINKGDMDYVAKNIETWASLPGGLWEQIAAKDLSDEDKVRLFESIKRGIISGEIKSLN